MPSALAIGDFSRATHLNIKALRHYHRIGLLEPAGVPMLLALGLAAVAAAVGALVVAVVVLGVLFEYVNGFHDAANAIATVVATRVLTPFQAIVMAGSLNFVGALSGEAVARTLGAGIVDSRLVSQDLVVAALVAAITWDLSTWLVGLPTSSSHALIFGLIGAAVAEHGLGVVVLGGVQKTTFGIGYSPAIAFLGGYALMLGLYWLLVRASFGAVNRFFGRAQILSSAYMAFSHGGNDGQKTMGVIALALYAYAGNVGTLEIPIWVKIVCALAMGLGTTSGGWRIMRTMGQRITLLRPVNGFAAETAAGTVIEIATRFGIPISTTHAISGAILGVGATRRLSAVRWGVAGRIVVAWVLTIPSCFALGYAIAKALGAAGLHPYARPARRPPSAYPALAADRRPPALAASPESPPTIERFWPRPSR